MPENEFEKKVSSELGGLKFKPSEEVWPKVEERIRRKKNRRVFAIIFLLAGIALLGYWQRGFLFGEKNDDIVNNEKQVEDKDKDKVEVEDKVKDEIGKQNKNEKTEVGVESETEKVKTVVAKNNQTNSKPKGVPDANKTPDAKMIIQKTKTPSKNIPVKTKKSDEDADMQVTVVDAGVKAGEKKDVSVAKENNDAVVKADIKADDKKEVVVKQTETNPVETKIDSLKTEIVEKKPEVIDVNDSVAKAIDAPEDSASIIVQKKSDNKKWKWGIEITPGISSMAEGLFSLSSNKSFADANYQAPSSGSSSSPPLARPSASKTGFAFQAGTFVTKQFSKISSLSIGLRYAYYSDNINIGAGSNPASGSLSQYLDSRGADYSYTARNSFSNYTNRYHFIELPVNYNLRLNKNKKNPLDLQLGFKLGRMIASNALVYDTTAGGIYYKSNGLFNKTQFGLSAGFNWTIVNKNQFQWGLGPVFNFHLNSLTDNPMDSKKYIFFAGLRSSLILNSKK